MNLKKLLDAVNAAQARVQSVAAQIDVLLNEDKLAEAQAMRPDLDAAKAEYDQANQLYLSMVNATHDSDPGRRMSAAHAGSVEVVKDEADQAFANDGEFFQAVKNAALYPGRSDVRLRSRKVASDATGMSEGVPADGGYLLPQQTASGVIEAMYSTGAILSRVARDPVSGNAITYNGIDETSRVDGSRKGGIVSGWLGEGGTLSAGKPKFRQVELKLRKVGALVYATDEQLEDTANLESWIGRAVPEELRFRAEDAIVEGIGGGMPLGILNAPAKVAVTRTDANKVQFADIVNMWARRYAGVNDYVWLVNQDVTPQLDAMVIGTEAPPRFVDYNQQGVMTMKGCPVLEVEYCQTLGTEGDILLASFSQYQVIDKNTVSAASSIHVQFLTDETAFRFIYRVDGKPLWHSAVTPLHGSNTISPFVSLTSAT